MNQEELEKAASDNLRQHRQDLGAIEARLTATAKSMTTPGSPRPTRAPAQLKDILKVVATAVGEAAEVIEDHANGTLRVSDGLIHEAARTTMAAREVLDSIILLEAVRPLTR